MTVRPSWVDLYVDGRNTNIGTGPKALKGTMKAQFKVRENGGIIDSIKVETFTGFDPKYNNGKGALFHELCVIDERGKVIHTHKTYL